MTKVKLEMLRFRKNTTEISVHMKETPVDLVRVAPAVTEPGLLPLGYPDPAALHVLPTAPTLIIPRCSCTEHSHSAMP